MPRYFFSRCDGHLEEDKEGIVLPTLHAARVEAVVYAGASMADEPASLWHSGRQLRVEVTDEEGTRLFAVVAHVIDYAANG